MNRPTLALAALLALTITLPTRTVAAQADAPPSADDALPDDLEAELQRDIGWQDHYKSVHWSEFVVAGAFLGGFILVDLFLEGSFEPKWEGGILFDDGFRDVIVGRSAGVRDRADLLSDIFWYTGSAYPLIDAIIVAGVVHERWDVSWQLGAMWMESTAFTGFMSRLTQRGTLRQRPLSLECGDDPDYSPLCFTRSANSSFISGHTAGAMAGAGQTCAAHQFLDLYPSELAGTLACAGNITVGLLAGVFRMVTDRHWVTDVIAGGLIGFGAGYLVPWLHFTLGEPDEPDGIDEAPTDSTRPTWLTLTPWSSGNGLGLGLSGTW